MMKVGQVYEEEFKTGALLKLQPGMEWHNAYVIDEQGCLGEETRIECDDIVLYLETQINRFQPDIKRYKCLFGDRFILILGASLRAA